MRIISLLLVLSCAAAVSAKSIRSVLLGLSKVLQPEVSLLGFHTGETKKEVSLLGFHTGETKKVTVTGNIRSSELLKSFAFQQKLRICNAYPSEAKLDLLLNDSVVPEGSDMTYKECRDIKASLKTGDRLEFRVAEFNAGSFAVTEVPAHDAVLLLVVYRHDSSSTAVSFESHVYASLLNSQIALIDTYKSDAPPSEQTLRIEDVPVASSLTPTAKGANGSRSEELRFDSVVAVNPGSYRVSLYEGNAVSVASANVTANAGGSYVVLRVGVDSPANHYPPELVVYPSSGLGKAVPSLFLLAMLVLGSLVTAA